MLLKRTHRSDVGQGKGPTPQLGRTQLTGSAQSLQTVQFLGNLKDTELLHVLHTGNKQTLAGVHGQADVVGGLEEQKEEEVEEEEEVRGGLPGQEVLRST